MSQETVEFSAQAAKEPRRRFRFPRGAMIIYLVFHSENDHVITATYTLELPADVMAAIEWHISQGYAGPEFLFSKDGTFPRYIDSI